MCDNDKLRIVCKAVRLRAFFQCLFYEIIHFFLLELPAPVDATCIRQCKPAFRYCVPRSQQVIDIQQFYYIELRGIFNCMVFSTCTGLERPVLSALIFSCVDSRQLVLQLISQE
jgi:hypothetical protein